MMQERHNTSVAGKRRNFSGLFDPAYVVLSLCVIAALAFLVSTTRKNAALASQLQIISKRVDDQASQRGDIVPRFTTTDLNGGQAAVELPSRQKHLLFIFSRYCSACASQLPVWDRLAQEMKADGLDVRGVSLDSAEDARAYFNGKDPNFPVIVAPNDVFSRAYRVERIPQVMLISEQGVVDWVHVGALTDAKLAELTAMIKSTETTAVAAAPPAAGN